VASNGYTAAVGVKDLSSGIQMIRGGFEFAEGTTYAGQMELRRLVYQIDDV